MTPERLRELIAAGENLDVEFKGEERRPLSDGDLVETVVCLANRPGDRPGLLLVGVEKDGRITGARPRHEAGLTDELRIQAMVSARTRPSLAVEVELVNVEGRHVLILEVPPVRQPVGTADGRYLRRAVGGDGKPACLPFHFHEMQGLQTSRGLLDYSATVVGGVGWGDLEPLEFDRLRRRIRESPGRGDVALLDLPDREVAKALGAVEGGTEVRAVRLLGLLLFGREEVLRAVLPAHEAAFQVISGTEVRVNDFFRWPLVRLMDEYELRFRARNQETELMVGMRRIGVPDYPLSAFREGIANALIHRDYTRLGAVHVQWHDDRLEISNPGGFPEGVRQDNLLVVSPRPRNPLLADAFKRAGIVERTARGIDRIFLDHLWTGRRAPSYARSTDSDVVLVLPGGPAHLPLTRLVVEEGRAGRSLGLDELLILDCLKSDEGIDLSEAVRLLQKPESESHLVIDRLAQWGLIEIGGEKANPRSRLTPNACRRLELRVTRLGRPPDAAEQERAVIELVAREGSASRREVAARLNLSADQAKRLLTGLVGRGELESTGRGKSTRYQRPPANTGAPVTNTGSPAKSGAPPIDAKPRGRGRRGKRS